MRLGGPLFGPTLNAPDSGPDDASLNLQAVNRLRWLPGLNRALAPIHWQWVGLAIAAGTIRRDFHVVALGLLRPSRVLQCFGQEFRSYLIQFPCAHERLLSETHARLGKTEGGRD